jgi:hypothetical protein
MSGNEKIGLLAIAAAAVVGVLAPANAAITFLDHFNGQTGFNLSTANGDYAGGNGTVNYLHGTPGTDTGFFGAGDSAIHITATDQYVNLGGDAPYGNVQYTSNTSGGFTVGLWFKVNNDATTDALLRVGNGDVTGSDMVILGYGLSSAGSGRVHYYSGQPPFGPAVSVVANAAGPATNQWAYMAATVDYTANTATLYMFDKDGVFQNSSSVAIGGDPAKYVTNSGELRIGEGLGFNGMEAWIDEISIDNVVLDQAAIQSRVTSMVAGNPLSVPEPASVALLGLGGLMLVRRRRGE